MANQWAKVQVQRGWEKFAHNQVHHTGLRKSSIQLTTRRSGLLGGDNRATPSACQRVSSKLLSFPVFRPRSHSWEVPPSSSSFWTRIKEEVAFSAGGEVYLQVCQCVGRLRLHLKGCYSDSEQLAEALNWSNMWASRHTARWRTTSNFIQEL